MPDTPRERPCFRRAICSAALVAALGLGVQGQQAPTYRAGVEAIPVDLVVTDREGRPVPGLGPEDFKVTVDGQPRRVLTAQFLSSAAAPAAPRPEARGQGGWDIDAAFESVYVGNHREEGVEAEPSRSIVIAIDQAGFSASEGRRVAAAAGRLLDVLHPNDRVGLAAFPPPGPFVRPTRDHQRVRQALGQVTGGLEPMPRTDLALSVADALDWTSGNTNSRDDVTQRYCATTGSVAECETELNRSAAEILNHARRQSLTSVRAIDGVLRTVSVEGTAVAVVLVSTGLYGTGGASRLGVDGEMRDLGRQITASRAMIYALHVDSTFLDRDSIERSGVGGFATRDADLRREGLRYLVGAAGGTTTSVSVGNDAAFRRLALELSAYYLLGVESQASDRDGRRHRLNVDVSRPGVTARTRDEFSFPEPKNLSGDDAVREALRAPEVARGLPMRLATQMMREPGTDRVRLVISAAIGAGVTAPEALRVGYLLQGAGVEGTSAMSEVERRELPLIGSGADATLAYLDTAQLNPGRYLLRLAALDEKGRLGSVQQVVDSTLVAGEIGTLSDVILIDPARALKDALTPVADGRVTGEAVEAFVEVYPSKGQSASSVTFDLSDTPGGRAIVEGSVKPEARDDRLLAGVRLDLRALPPGLYMLNARVLDGERVVGRTSRPFLLDRAPAAGAAVEPRAALVFAATGRLVRGFSREEALRPEALTYFLDRMSAFETASPAPPIGDAEAALRAGRFDAALAALPATSDALSVAFLKGLSLFGQGQLEPAAQQFRAALRLSNDFLPAAFYLGACYAAGGKDREAVGAWQTSLVSESGSRLIYEVLADALLRLNEGREAASILEEARERWPGDDLFDFRMAAAKGLLGERAEALGMLEPYLERHPESSEALFLAIRLLYEAHDAGTRLKGPAEDRALAAKYGAAYAAAGGANAPLVARWVAAIAR